MLELEGYIWAHRGVFETPDHMIVVELASQFHPLNLKKKPAWRIKHTSQLFSLGRDRATEIPTVRILNTFHVGSISSCV